MGKVYRNSSLWEGEAISWPVGKHLAREHIVISNLFATGDFQHKLVGAMASHATSLKNRTLQAEWLWQGAAPSAPCVAY